jgi:hypothetical protein
MALISVQCRGVFTTTDVGKLANIYVGSGNVYTGISGVELDASSIGSGTQLEIISIEQDNKNAIGQYTKLLCSIASSETTSEDFWDRVGTTLRTHHVNDDVELDKDLIVHGKLTVDGLIDPTGIILTPQATAPSTVNGTCYYDSVAVSFKFRQNDTWIVLSEENLWDRTSIGGGNYAITPHTATDYIQLPTGTSNGAVPYLDYSGNKTLVADGSLVWGGTVFAITSIAPYIKLLDESVDSNYIEIGPSITGGFLRHHNTGGASVLYVDAKPKDGTFASTINFGANTIASATTFVFHNGKASYAAHPTFSADAEIIDKKYVDDHSGAQLPVTNELTISANGQTAFTLSQTPANVALVKLYLNGQRRRYTVDFTVSGTTLTWNDPSGLTLKTTDTPLVADYEY